jgi:hypothetical protein
MHFDSRLDAEGSVEPEECKKRERERESKYNTVRARQTSLISNDHSGLRQERKCSGIDRAGLSQALTGQKTTNGKENRPKDKVRQRRTES